MVKIISVRFKQGGKAYSFDPGELAPQAGDYVVVDTARGAECGEVVQGVQEVPDASVPKELKPVLRMADSVDIRRRKQNEQDEKRAFDICSERIRRHGLDMKLVDAEYTLDRAKLLFYFTADGRVDFRDLVKDLAGVFHTRIELRQIGVRDEAKMIGGLGTCGRELCCCSYLDDFHPVSINMAKDQNLSLNPAKISGVCGRLMCCLKYEQEAYLDLLRTTPKVNAVVSTPDGKGVVIDQNLLTGKLTVRLDKNPDAAPGVYKVKDVRVIRDGQIKLNKKEIEAFKKLEK